MASIYFKRLQKKYGKTKVKGKKYQSLINDILVHNNEKIGNAVGRLSNDNYAKSIKKLSKVKQKVVKLPDISEVLPKRSVFLIKGAESGKFISQTLRKRLEKDLRDTLKNFEKTGKGKLEIQRGRTTGKINPELIDLFQKKIKNTFESYTKRDKKTGVPPNIKNIAVTETRSVMNSIKSEYNAQLLKKNPGIIMTKTWLHNRRLSEVPRGTHVAMNKITLPVEVKFRVNREKEGGFDLMKRPHDPDAPLNQKIGCNCDIIFKAQLPNISPKR